MKTFFHYLILLAGIAILLVSDACREELVLFEVDCSQCYIDRPAEGPFTIKVTINGENPAVPLTIFLGPYEKNQVRYTDTAYHSPFTMDVYPAREYTVRAEYTVGTKTIYAFDAGMIDLVKVTSQCDTTCWVIRGGEADVRLKYQKEDKLPGK